MVVKFLSKYILEVIPSIVATVVGAYIVTHYINAKSDTDKPKAAITAPASTARDAGSDETAKAVEAPAPKAAKSDPVAKPTETVSAPVEPRRHQPTLREKTAAKPVVSPSAEAVKETAKEVVKEPAKAEDTRDANEIAREAIARLRNSDQAKPVETPRTQEAVRAPDAPRPQERAKISVTYTPPSAPQTPIQAPPMNTAPPLNEVTVAPAPQPPVVRADDSFRPTPPADIPSRPLDLRVKENTKDRTSVAEDVVSTAKSVFHAVIPGIN